MTVLDFLGGKDILGAFASIDGSESERSDAFLFFILRRGAATRGEAFDEVMLFELFAGV